MRHRISILCIQLMSFTVVASQVVVGAGSEAEIVAARHAVEAAEIEYRLYRHVDFPRQRRHFASQETLIGREIEQLQRQVHEYRNFDRNRHSKPLLITLQNAELRLLDARQRRDNVRAEHRAAIRFHADRCRLHELKIGAAEARLAAITRVR